MHITASINNGSGSNEIVVSTEGNEKKILIAAKPDGRGSSVNGGELLFLSLATCFCNDIYREAAKRKINVQSVNVVVDGNFGKEGEPGSNITFMVNVEAPENSPAEIADLIAYVDQIAEIHNTLRQGVAVTLQS